MINQLYETLISIETPIKFKVRQIMSKPVAKLAPVIEHILKKISILLIPLPLFMLITGIKGIIEHESPDNLASLSSVGSGFFNFFDMHSLIIAGAFGITFIIWFLTRNIWTNSKNEFSKYEEFVEEKLVNNKQGNTHCSAVNSDT